MSAFKKTPLPPLAADTIGERSLTDANTILGNVDAVAFLWESDPDFTAAFFNIEGFHSSVPASIFSVQSSCKLKNSFISTS